jgi:hypothetical protein
MKQRDSYYHEFFKRPAQLKLLLLNFFLGISFWLRIPIEVITRRNMGERYFNILLSSVIGAALIITPFYFSRGYSSTDFSMLFGMFGTWLAYTILYLVSMRNRWREIRKLPSVWDMKRFSLSEGSPHPFFRNINIPGVRTTPRLVSTVLEPGVFLLAGIILSVMDQPIGAVFIACAIVYSLGYVGAYYLAEHFIMDKIDEMICNEELHRIFVKDEEPERGFEFRSKRPTDKKKGKRLYDDYMDSRNKDDKNDEDDEPFEVK